MDKLPYKQILFIIIIAFFGFAFYSFYTHISKPSHLPNPLPIVSPVPTPIANTVTVQSPDGKMRLTLKEELDKVTVSIFNGKSQSEIFWKNIAENEKVTVPFNTFSPDNRYIFLRDIRNGVESFLVLSTDGKAISQDSQTVEILDLFHAKYDKYKVTDVTGWGGVNLIVVNTDKIAGGEGPSFWFDLSSHSFIQLADRFN